MGWTATNPVNIGDDTMKSHWDKLWDNCAFCYIPPGTVELFGQSSAPTGWTKKTDWTDGSMLVYTTGSIGSGGSDNPTVEWTTDISLNSESAHVHSMQNHTHSLVVGAQLIYPILSPFDRETGQPSVANTGGGSAHTHTVNQDTFIPKYQKIIAATKDSGDWTDANPVSAVGNAMKQSAHWEVLWANIEYLYLEAAMIQLFGQSSAPIGWTKKTDWVDNSMLVYTTGSIGSGGSDNPISWETNISLQNESAHTHPMPHTHSLLTSVRIPIGTGYSSTTGGPSVANTGTGSAHTHIVDQDTFAPKYQKIIAAIKDSGDWTESDPVTLYDPTKKKQYDTAWDNIKFNYFAATTIMLFGQSTSPTGWTKKTDWADNSMLVYTTGSIGSGGSDDPTSWLTDIGVQNESSHIHSMQSHTHTLPAGAEPAGGTDYSSTTGGPSVANTGGGSAHTHTVNQDTFIPKYQKIIAATKDA